MACTLNPDRSASASCDNPAATRKRRKRSPNGDRLSSVAIALPGGPYGDPHGEL
jgi:hypothetical protein